jgi:hypothetical protein
MILLYKMTSSLFHAHLENGQLTWLLRHSPPAAHQTAYKWSFASKSSSADANALRAVREDVNAASHGQSGENRDQSASYYGNGGARVIGPTLPSASVLVLAREAASDHQTAKRDMKRKRDRAEAKDRLEEEVGPREVGREGMLEKKRTRRENDRAFREKGDDGGEADESTLLGGGDGFRRRPLMGLASLTSMTA